MRSQKNTRLLNEVVNSYLQIKPSLQHGEYRPAKRLLTRVMEEVREENYTLALEILINVKEMISKEDDLIEAIRQYENDLEDAHSMDIVLPKEPIVDLDTLLTGKTYEDAQEYIEQKNKEVLDAIALEKRRIKAQDVLKEIQFQEEKLDRLALYNPKIDNIYSSYKSGKYQKTYRDATKLIEELRSIIDNTRPMITIKLHEELFHTDQTKTLLHIKNEGNTPAREIEMHFSADFEIQPSSTLEYLDPDETRSIEIQMNPFLKGSFPISVAMSYFDGISRNYIDEMEIWIYIAEHNDNEINF